MSYTIGVRVVEYLAGRRLLPVMSRGQQEELSLELDRVLDFPDSGRLNSCIERHDRIWYACETCPLCQMRTDLSVL